MAVPRLGRDSPRTGLIGGAGNSLNKAKFLFQCALQCCSFSWHRHCDNQAVKQTKRENMKPISIIVGKDNRFPLIDCNYRPMTLDGYRGQCVKTEEPSFRNISGQYFQNEARHDFLVEAVCFVLIIFTAAAPLVIAAHAVADLCRTFAQL